MALQLEPNKLSKKQLTLLYAVHHKFTLGVVACRIFGDERRPKEVVRCVGDYLGRVCKIANNECDDLAAFDITNWQYEWFEEQQGAGGIEFVARVNDICDFIHTTVTFIEGQLGIHSSYTQLELGRAQLERLRMFAESVTDRCIKDTTNPSFSVIAPERMLAAFGL